MQFGRYACSRSEKKEDPISVLGVLTINGWPGNGENSATCARPKPGHFMGVYQTKSPGTAPDDHLPGKCLKYLYDEHSESIL